MKNMNRNKNENENEKTSPRLLSYHDFQTISAFLTQDVFVACPRIFFTKKVIFWPFSQNIDIFSEI